MNSRLWHQIRVWIWKSGPMDCPFKVPIVSGRKDRSVQRHPVNGAMPSYGQTNAVDIATIENRPLP